MPSLLTRLRIRITNKVETEYKSLINEQNTLSEKINTEKETLGKNELKLLINRKIKVEYLLQKLELKIGRRNFEGRRNTLFWKKRSEGKISPTELENRILLLESIELLWLPLWDFRFGQLIQNIVDRNHEFSHIGLYNTSEWINMVRSTDLNSCEEYNELDSLRNPKRIPVIINTIKEEWLYDEIPFCQYILNRLEIDQPGGTFPIVFCGIVRKK